MQASTEKGREKTLRGAVSWDRYFSIFRIKSVPTISLRHLLFQKYWMSFCNLIAIFTKIN